MEEQELGVKQQNADAATTSANASAKNADTNAAELAETGRKNKEGERLAREKQGDDAKTSAALRTKYNAEAVRDLTWAEANKSGKDGAKGPTMEHQKSYSQAINTVIDDFLQPTELSEEVDEFGSKKTIKKPLPAPAGFESTTPHDKLRIQGYAQQIGIANPNLGISTAVEAAAAIHQAQRGGGAVQVDPGKGLIRVNIGGQPRVFKVPRETIEMLSAQAKPKK
jgi:hypothetical protein